ncbi:hypothetical protein [Rhodococcus sp. NPDC076796]|uniref:hypothetical protein n=1 Tax=Rhodococcus sp. NPDC076796 TaxID=3154859 RepID=UPI002ADBDB53|nr:hypothetical protein [Rhodococcus sp. (in: high G+C Gram-positive bacteria)]
MEQENHVAPRVHIVDSASTADASDDIIRGLYRLGVDASVPVPTGENQVLAVVVLLSAGALADPTWLHRVEALRSERLVPVKVSDILDSEIPIFLRELNWVFYQPNDPAFLAHLFTGINTDASRFRNARDTRALAERWEIADRDPDLLIESLSEARRRIHAASLSADGADPMLPPHQAHQLAANFQHRFRAFSELLRVGNRKVPSCLVPLLAMWLAWFRARLDHELIDGATTPVAFLAASRRHAARVTRRRRWRLTYRAVLAGVTAVAVISTVLSVQQAIKRSTNAVAFAIGDSAATSRPDLAAIKAGASLVDSGEYPGSDGRFRIAINALSENWALGYLPLDVAVVSAARFLADGSISAVDYDGAIWNWNTSEETRSKNSANLQRVTGGDISAAGGLAVITDGVDISVVDAEGVRALPGPEGVGMLRLAPADDRALVQSGNGLYVVDRIASESPGLKHLGEWDSVIDIVQTEGGHATALAERGGNLELVHDDGSIVESGRAPDQIDVGALSSDGTKFSLAVDGTIWTSADGGVFPSGLLIPGVVKSMRTTDDGLVLISDRTRGSWAAHPGLGIVLGPVCGGIVAMNEFAVDEEGGRVLCLGGAGMMMESLSSLRPTAVAASIPEPVQTVSSNGRLTSLSLVDGFIRIDRADGTSFAFDSAGLSFGPDFTRPPAIADVDFFATGALIEADSRPTTVAMNSNGDTFAIGFVGGHVIEVDVDEDGFMAPVGSWILPDHASVVAISWSPDSASISATTDSGTMWNRPSCSGCWASRTVVEHIADRAWMCYHRGDIEQLGDTVRSAFRLRDCETYQDGEK